MSPPGAGAATHGWAAGLDPARERLWSCFHTALRNPAGTAALAGFLQAAHTPISSQNVNTKKIPKEGYCIQLDFSYSEKWEGHCGIFACRRGDEDNICGGGETILMVS